MIPRFEKRVIAFAIEISAVAIGMLIVSFGIPADFEWLKFLIVAVIYLLVTIVSLLFSNGQTYGKKIQKIKVVKLDGTDVNFFILVLRELFKTVLSLLTLGLYSIVAYFALTEKKASRTIHDYIFKTKVIDLDTKNKKYNRNDHFLDSTESMKKRGL